MQIRVTADFFLWYPQDTFFGMDSNWPIIKILLRKDFPNAQKIVRPIIMQLDLQSVENVPCSTFAMSFCSEKCWKLVFLASE